METELNKENQIALTSLTRALLIKQTLNTIGLNGQIRLNADGTAKIQMNNPGKNSIETIRELTKVFHCKFDKSKTTCGFLKYVTMVNGVLIYANTTECFFGGKPELIFRRPRTTAVCHLEAPNEG